MIVLGTLIWFNFERKVNVCAGGDAYIMFLCDMLSSDEVSLAHNWGFCPTWQSVQTKNFAFLLAMHVALQPKHGQAIFPFRLEFDSWCRLGFRGSAGVTFPRFRDARWGASDQLRRWTGVLGPSMSTSSRLSTSLWPGDLRCSTI